MDDDAKRMREELEEVSDRIDDLKASVEADHDLISESDPQEWHESGTIRPDLDDRSIAP